MQLRTFIAAGALLALPGQALAQTAAPCLSQAEIRALASFAMPSILTGVIDNCNAQTGPQSFLATQGRSLVATYAAKKDSAWPTARQAFFRLAQGGKSSDQEAMRAMSGMPDAALQPFVEGMIGGLVGARLKPSECAAADKLMRILAPLPPENTAELVSTVLALAEADKKPAPGGLTICKP